MRNVFIKICYFLRSRWAGISFLLLVFTFLFEDYLPAIPFLGQSKYEVFFSHDFAIEGLTDPEYYRGKRPNPEGVVHWVVLDVNVGNTGKEVQDNIIVTMRDVPKERKFLTEVKPIDALAAVGIQPSVRREVKGSDQLLIIENLGQNTQVHFQYVARGPTAENRKWHEIQYNIEAEGLVLRLNPGTGYGLRTFLARMSFIFSGFGEFWKRL